MDSSFTPVPYAERCEVYIVSALLALPGTTFVCVCCVMSPYVVWNCQSEPVGAFDNDGLYALSQRSSAQLPTRVRVSNVLTPYTWPGHITCSVRSWRNPLTWIAVG